MKAKVTSLEGIFVSSLGPIYASVSVNAAMTLAIVFSLKTIELLQNGFGTHFQVTQLFSMRTELQALSQH